jgi:hypothetical protein
LTEAAKRRDASEMKAFILVNVRVIGKFRWRQLNFKLDVVDDGMVVW